MKFGEHLLSQAKPEWREKHIDYEALKAILYDRIHDSGEQRETIFFKKCTDELKKVVGFYNARAADCFRRCKALEDQANPAATGEKQSQQNATVKCTGRVRSMWRRMAKVFRRPLAPGEAPPPEEASVARLPASKENELKAASEEFYFELECLKKFQEDNATGFRKILKKHDKMWKNNRGAEWHDRKVSKASFVTEKSLDNLCERVEKFRILLERGDRKKAMEKLRVPTTSERRSKRILFFSGVFWAVFVSAFLIAMLSAIYSSAWWHPPWVIVGLYRGYFLIILLASLVALCMYIWEKNGVNYVLIFELNPRAHLTSENLFTICGACWALWALSLLGYVTAHWLNLPRLCFPLILTAVYLVLLFNPFKCAFPESRFWLLARLFSCFAAPFRHGTFADFWLANQLSTLSTAFVDTYFLICFYSTGVTYNNGWLQFKITNLTDAPRTNQTISDFVEDPVWGTDMETGNGFCASDSYGIRPAVALIPATIRILQSFKRYRDSKLTFPHLYNAGKYVTYVPTAVFGALYRWHSVFIPKPRKSVSPYFHLWILSAAISSGAAFFWDVRVDWKLLSKRTGRHPFLREKLLYPCFWIYYVAAIFDGAVRFRWVISVSLPHSDLSYTPNEFITTVLAVAECFRRFVWSALRLENEQLNNVEHLRVTRRTFGVPFKKLNDFGNMMKQEEEPAKRAVVCALRKKAKSKSTSPTASSANSKDTIM